MIGPDQRAFEAAIVKQVFRLGVLEQKWLLCSVSWPFVVIEVVAKDGCWYPLRFNCAGYPQVAPTAGPRDTALNTVLPFDQCPRGNGGAYSGLWIPASASSVDHFRPKSASPQLAYDWNNFRLTSKEMNCNKGDDQAVLDPVAIQLGWFTLRFDSFLIEAEANLQAHLALTIERTVRVLRLNHDAYVDHRFEVWASLQLLREKLAVDAVYFELVSAMNSLVSGNFAGKLPDLSLRGAASNPRSQGFS